MTRILVAEDDPHILRLISMWLTRQGATVLEARNGLIARDLLRQDPVDVLVTDVNMPGLDGLQLINEILPEQRVSKGIVVLTNRWDHAEIRDQLGALGVQVLPKPFSPSRLYELIEALVAGQSESSVEGESAKV